MRREHLVAVALADALLAGGAEVEGFVARVAWVLGRKHRWIAPLCKRVFRQFGSSLDDRSRAKLIEWIRNDRGYHDAWLATRPPRIAHYVLEPPRMAPRKGALAACEFPTFRRPAISPRGLASRSGSWIGSRTWRGSIRLTDRYRTTAMRGCRRATARD